MIALGTSLSEFSISPAAIATISMAAYAKTTPDMTRIGPYQWKGSSLGQNPPGLLQRFWIPAWWPPMSSLKTTTTRPTTRKTTIAATLRIDAQNSNSPKARAESRLMNSTTASAISTVAQVGMVGNQNWT